MNHTFKHPSKYKKVKKEYPFKYVPIRECKIGTKYRFEEHEHTIADYEYNYSYMTGVCVTNEIGPNVIFGKKEHLIEIKLDAPRAELEEYDNKLMFYFPHDDELYNDVKVVEPRL